LGLLHLKFVDANANALIKGEGLRAVTNPRIAVSYDHYKQVYGMATKGDAPKVECDILVELYLANASDKTIYIRTCIFSCEIDGQAVTLKPEADFSFVNNADGRPFEYCLDVNGHEYTLPNILTKAGLEPGMPVEGWVRFQTRENPEQLDAANPTFKVTVIDSLGREHPIPATAHGVRTGTIAYREITRR
jgi:hypothetical protein